MAKVTISPKLKKALQNKTATFKWGGGKVDYAAKVHNQRPWTLTTLYKFDVGKEFQDATGGGRQIDEAFTHLVGKLGSAFVETINNYDYKLKSGGRKRFRPDRTWGKITDSGRLARSMKIKIRRR